MGSKNSSNTTSQVDKSESLNSKELCRRLKSRLQAVERRKKSKSIYLLLVILSAFTVGLSYYCSVKAKS